MAKLTKEDFISALKEMTILEVKELVDAMKEEFGVNPDAVAVAAAPAAGSFVLPHGTGKTKRILVIAKGAQAEEAKKAGADYVGDVELIEKIQKENWFDYDVIVATPDMMPHLGKIGKILGPKGLMPNPKTNTVTPNPAKAVMDIQKGMVEFRTDQYGNIHGIIGKTSFDDVKLKENMEYVVSTISKLKPSTVKGKFIQNISLSATMGPGIQIDKNSFDI